jgi:hypothetical protein
MTDDRPDGQLDVPLVWERASESGRPAPARRQAPGESGARPGLLRLVLVAGLDLGFVLSCVGAAWGVGLLCGARMDFLQMALAGLVGLEVAWIIAWGCLWAWRGTPGMLLAGVGYDDPLPFGRAGTVWLWWSVASCVLGLPLVVRVGGTTGVDRLAGSALSSH